MLYVKETAPRLKKMTSLKVVQEDEMRVFVRKADGKVVGELRKGLREKATRSGEPGWHFNSLPVRLRTVTGCQ